MTPRKHDSVTAVGRRKSAIARVRVTSKNAGTFGITVNKRDYKDYFNYFEWQDIILAPLKAVGMDKAEIEARILGGGIKSQAEALRLAIARALVEGEAGLRATLRRAGFLTRDSRIKERKKPGLKKARRAPQWSKR